MGKITAYGPLVSPASNDVLPVVDVSDTTMASSGTTKKIAVSDLLAGADAAGAAAAAQAAAQGSSLQKTANLSDLANAATARTNLGLGTAATHDAADFDAAGAAATALTSSETYADTNKLAKSANLSDVASASTARTNLGLSGAATATLPLSIANGGSGQATQQAAIDALTGTQSSGKVLRSDGTHATLANIQVSDVPTLNQNTSGSSASCTGNAATATNLAGGATLPAYLAPKAVSLTFVGAGTTLVDASLGNAFNLTLTASTTTLGNPSNPVDGEVIRVRVIQDATGSRTLAYGTAYDFGAAGAPTLSTAANKVDILGFEYVASISKWCYLGSGLGF